MSHTSRWSNYDRNIRTSVSLTLWAEGVSSSDLIPSGASLSMFSKPLRHILAIFDIKSAAHGRNGAPAGACDRKSDLPVIFLPSRPRTRRLTRLFRPQDGRDDFNPKPFSPRLLVELVKAISAAPILRLDASPQKERAKILERGR